MLSLNNILDSINNTTCANNNLLYTENQQIIDILKKSIIMPQNIGGSIMLYNKGITTYVIKKIQIKERKTQSKNLVETIRNSLYYNELYIHAITNYITKYVNNHNGIIKLYSGSIIQNNGYIIMEYVTGNSIYNCIYESNIISKTNKCNKERVVLLMFQLLHTF